MAGMKRIRSLRSMPVDTPRFFLSFEDWITLVPTFAIYVAVSIAVQQAEWVRNFPPLYPTVVGGLFFGLLATRLRLIWPLLHGFVVILGFGLIILSVQSYADGRDFAERVVDLSLRLPMWWSDIRAGEISTDNLPFVTTVHLLGFFLSYIAAWSIYRWRIISIAIVPAAVGLLVIVSTIKGQPSGAVVLFTLGALLLAGRMAMQRRLVHWERVHVDYPEFISFRSLQVTVVLSVLLVIFAWAVPLGKQADAFSKVGEKIATPIVEIFEPLSKLVDDLRGVGGNFHKFEDSLAIRGDIKLGETLLFEVQSDKPFLMRGTSYDFYTGRGWKRGEHQTLLSAKGEMLTAAIEAVSYRARVAVELQVRAFDDGNTLFTLGTPLGARDLSIKADVATDYLGELERIVAADGIDVGQSYTTRGTYSIATPQQLLNDGVNYPAWIRERYLQLPDDLPLRVGEETSRILDEADSASPYESVIIINEYLRLLEIDFNLRKPPARRDVVDYLLFDSRKTYFDLSATTMVVMLRTQGIPARIAVGYALDTEDTSGLTYSVRKNDAYSWVEVYFPQYGWVEFDPSSDRPAMAVLLTEEMGDQPALRESVVLDSLSLPVPEIDLTVDDLLSALKGDVDEKQTWLIAVWISIGVIAFLMISVFGSRLFWLWNLRGLESTSRYVASVQRLSGWAGISVNDKETIREWGERLGKRIHKIDDLRVLIESFEADRYGPPQNVKNDSKVSVKVYTNLRKSLVSAILRRFRRLSG